MEQPQKSHLKPYTLPTLSDGEWGYIAGILEAEGHIRKCIAHKYKSYQTYGYDIQVAQVGKELAQYLKLKLRTGWIFTRPPESPNRQAVTYFECGSRLAIKAILEKVLPFFVTKYKREQGIKVLNSIKEQVNQNATQV